MIRNTLMIKLFILSKLIINKIFIILFLNICLINNSSASDMSLILIDKLFENGAKVCKKWV